ncbi:MAG: RNA polymerase subunit sigma-70 [Betaproteobacteria bacterium]|nr:RNA polymerase subunit sigma-70 [Betaproteobacteria bacterium]
MSSRRRTSTGRSRGRRAAPARRTARSKCGRYGRCSHAGPALDVPGRESDAEAAARGVREAARRLHGLCRRAEEGTGAGRQSRPAANLGGAHRGQGRGARRPVRRDERAACGLLPARGAGHGGGARLGEAPSQRAVWCGGSATGVDVAATAEAVARASYGKLVAFLAARTRDVAAAEDALAEAFAAALAEWPAKGIPRAPEAWLLTVARRKLIDAARRRQTGVEAEPTLVLIADELVDAADGDAPIPDERLRLMFACAHPAIDAGVRAPLMLQAVLGFDAAAIGSAFLVAPATMGQRLVRAKARIRDAGIPFRVPEAHELAERLDAVLEAIYAVFTEGWADPAGTQPSSRNLAEEGIWLGRLIATLLPEAPEALGLLALMLHADARRHARRSAAGEFVPLAAQDPARWDRALIDEAEALLLRASAMRAPGRFQLEAAVQSAHAARRLTGKTDWSAIVQLYDALLAITGSVVVAINRAVAIAETRGAAAGLAELEPLADDARLAQYQPYWAARAALLARAGNAAAAAAAYQRAIGLESDPALRAFLQRELLHLHDVRGSTR